MELTISASFGAKPMNAGKSFGSNAAAWWGFQYNDLITDPKPREVCTIYEIEGILTCPPDDDARSRAMSQVLIAIVDDEEPVRDATKTLVRSLGY